MTTLHPSDYNEYLLTVCDKIIAVEKASKTQLLGYVMVVDMEHKERYMIRKEMYELYKEYTDEVLTTMLYQGLKKLMTA